MSSVMEVVDATASESELREFVYGLVRSLKPALVVETGTYRGGMTVWLGSAVHENGSGRVISCDPIASHCYTARERLRDHYRDFPVEVRECMSADVPEVSDADFLFLDSDYRYREDEIRRAKPGAVIVVHDAYKSYDPNIAPLAPLIESLGGIAFRCGIEGRGFGILVKR